MGRLPLLDKLLYTIVLLYTLHFTLYTVVYGAFKDLGFGVRASGLGGAFTAICDDASAPLYNPAGVIQSLRHEAMFTYIKPYLGLKNVDLSMMYLGYIQPESGVLSRIIKGNVGISITDFGYELYRENIIMLTYSRHLDFIIKGLSTGINLKYLIHRYNWDEDTRKTAEMLDDKTVLTGNSSSGITIDLGLLISIHRLSFGLNMKNITQPDVGIAVVDKVPMEIRFGTAYKIPLWRKADIITFSGDINYRAQNWGREKLNIHMGTEMWFWTYTFGIRAGYNINELTLGLSFHQNIYKEVFIQIDYALAWSTRLSDNIGSHRIATTVRF